MTYMSTNLKQKWKSRFHTTVKHNDEFKFVFNSLMLYYMLKVLIITYRIYSEIIATINCMCHVRGWNLLLILQHQRSYTYYTIQVLYTHIARKQTFLCYCLHRTPQKRAVCNPQSDILFSNLLIFIMKLCRVFRVTDRLCYKS